MGGFFVRIYDCLSRHKLAAWLLMLAITALLAVPACRLNFGEDISDFLPGDENSAKYSQVSGISGNSNSIAVIFKADEDHSEALLAEAIDEFAALWTADSTNSAYHLQSKADMKSINRAVKFVQENYPLFLTDEDYARIDSLLATDGYMTARANALKEYLRKPSAAFSLSYLRSDPLLLFSPVLQRMQNLSAGENFKNYNGYISDKSGRYAFAFITSPYGGSETAQNYVLSDKINKVIESMADGNSEVEISAVGAPLIAVENSQCIKKDSTVALCLAGVIILLLLVFTLRRADYILWIVFASAFGFLCALAAMSLVKGSMSVIVLGICSVIAGIAVNYPLHYLSHLRHCGSKRDALKETANPLFVGNITTVSAFLCLVFLDASALRDLGLFASVALISTMLFSVIFLPVLCAAPAAQHKTEGNKSFKLALPKINISKKGRSVAFVLFCAVTAVLFVFSLGNSFDSDISNINYMTEQQRADLALLSGLRQEKPDEVQMYMVAEAAAADYQTALENNETALAAAAALQDSSLVRKINGLGNFIPSRSKQAAAIARWQAFLAAHPQLTSDFEAACTEADINAKLFAPFTSLGEKQFETRDIDFFEPVISLTSQGYVINSTNGTMVVNHLRVPKDKADEVKALLNEELGAKGFVFDSSDMGNKLAVMLSDELNYIGYVCAVVVFVFLLISFGRLEISLISFIPLAVSWIWILGLMNIFGVKFNIVNIILATFIFGQGDDYTIFITEGLMHRYAYSRQILKSYTNSIILSAAIMFAGVGMLAFSTHPAMRSLGLVATIGMAVVVFFAFYLTPLAFRFLTEKKGSVRQVPLSLKRLTYSFVSISYFAVVAFVIMKPYTFFKFTVGKCTEKKRERLHVIMYRFFNHIIHKIPGVKFELCNKAGETFEKPAMIICNHQSHLDLACLLTLSPKIVILTNDWVWKNPFYGNIIRNAEFYPVSDGVEANLDRLADLTARGYSVIVFPEGTRTLTGEIGKFRQGAFYMAQKLHLDIVPITIHGADKVLPKNDFMLREGFISLEVGERIKCEELAGTAPLKLSHEFYKRYCHDYKALCLKKEKTYYYISYIRAMYMYKGREIENGCKKAIKLIQRNSVLIDRPRPDGSLVYIKNCSQGEFALMFALVNKNVRIVAADDDEDRMLVANNLSSIPTNLTFSTEQPADVAETIDLKLL